MALPGPCPLTDYKLELCPLLEASVPGPEVDYKWAQGLDSLRDSPKDTVIKGDHQKADDAAVPDHLWLLAFAMGYGDAAYPARHLEALNLPPTSQVGFLGKSKPPAGWRGALSGLRFLP